MLSDKQLQKEMLESPVWAKIRIGFEEEEKKSGEANLAKKKESDLIALIHLIRTGFFNVGAVMQAGLKEKEDRENWGKAREYLKKAENLQDLPEDYYQKHQSPYENLHPFTKVIREQNFHVDTQSEAYSKLGKKGGASESDGASRGLAVRLIAGKLPIKELGKSSGEITAELAKLVGIEVTAGYCREVIKRQQSKETKNSQNPVDSILRKPWG